MLHSSEWCSQTEKLQVVFAIEMFSAKLLRVTSISLKSGTFVKCQNAYSTKTRQAFRRAETVKKGRSLRDIILTPANNNNFLVGKCAVAGASVLGMGSLCYYGLGLSNEVGAYEKSMIWPDYVKTRIRDTYLYFGGSVALTAASAMAVARTPAIMNLLSKFPIATGLGGMAVAFCCIQALRSIPYQKGFGSKQLTWMALCGVVGTSIAPLYFIGGPLLMRAAWYTAGVVGGLSTVAACAPSEKFLSLGGPLAMGFGVVLAASVGSMFLPPTAALGASLYSISLYGGLVLCGGLLLFDTQRIIKQAETPDYYGTRTYDPVSNSVSIYLSAVNIFIRIAIHLFNGKRK